MCDEIKHMCITVKVLKIKGKGKRVQTPREKKTLHSVKQH